MQNFAVLGIGAVAQIWHADFPAKGMVPVAGAPTSNKRGGRPQYVIVAMGPMVRDRDDAAARILHDATTISCGDGAGLSLNGARRAAS